MVQTMGYDLFMQKAMCLLLVIGVMAWPQQKTQHKKSVRPEFKDYAVEQVYAGPPAAPKLNKDQRMFRTMIRGGAKAKVEFAGHYTVPRWGCGAGCSTFVIVDSIRGAVYDGFSVSDVSLSWMEKHGEPRRLEFHPKSRLLKITGCPGETNCGFYDYEMVEGKGLKLVRKELLPKQYQY
jgi:hypothetical protein